MGTPGLVVEEEESEANERTTMHSDYSTLFAVFRDTGVINREGFYLPTYHPETGECTGHIGAQAFAREILNALGRGEDDDDESERIA